MNNSPGLSRGLYIVKVMQTLLFFKNENLKWAGSVSKFLLQKHKCLRLN